MADAHVQTFDSTRDTLLDLERARPDVVRLARVASLARKIEPELLRALRLALADRFDGESRPHAGTESALWFSALIESRGPDSITLLSEFSRELQHQLKADSALLEAARAVIEELHRDLPAVLRWEEELVYVALTDTLTEIARQRRIRHAAREALETISSNRRPGLEDRVREMWPRLPAPATRNSYLANVHHLCDVRALRRRGETRAGMETAFETVLLQVAKTNDAWQLSFREDGGQATIRVPALDPVTLYVLKNARSRRAARSLVLHPEQSVEVPFENRPLVLRTIDGRVYSLAPEVFDRANVSAAQAVADGQTLNEARLIVLGDGGTGKTSLVSRLVGGEFDANSVVTHGIQISDWRVRSDERGEILVHLWDFGGQQIYYGVHDAFFARTAAYLLVVSDRRDAGDEAETWLSQASAIAGDAPFIVALARSDVRDNEVDLAALRRKFPNVKAVVKTSARSGMGIAELTRVITETVAALPSVGEVMPRAYVDVRQRLLKTDRNYITLSDYAALCRAVGLNSPDLHMLAYFHDLGMVLHFADDPDTARTCISASGLGCERDRRDHRAG